MPPLSQTVLLQANRDVPSSDTGGWVLLGLGLLLVVFAIRTFSNASKRRLQGGAQGPESDTVRERKRTERKKRREEAVAAGKSKKNKAKAKSEEKRDNKENRSDKDKTQKVSPDGQLGSSDTSASVQSTKASGLLLPEGKSLHEGLSKTRKDGFVGRLSKLFGGKQLDDTLLDELESVMFTADIGVRTSQKLLDGLSTGLRTKDISEPEKAWAYLRDEAMAIFEKSGNTTSLQDVGKGSPHVVLVVGVNGAGKTTTIGKLAHRCVAEGRKVLIGAGDTFRAAAVDQLEVWAKRVGADIVQGEDSQDPSSVLFDAVKQAESTSADVVFLDTAGRLHSNKNLIAELKKVQRVIGKAMPGAPHEVLLVLDGTTGQNAIAQAHTFGEELGVTGIVVTKLDGTAKGGVVLGICDEMQLPIAWIGVGERTEDLKAFSSNDFVSALFG